MIIQVEAHNGGNALAEDVEAEVFVGRMDSVALKAEAHQHRLDTQHPLKVADDGDAPAATYRQRTLAKGLGEAFFSGFVGRQRDGADIAFSAVHRGHFDAHTIRRDAVDVVGEELLDFSVLLMRHETTTHFGIGFGG